MAVVRMPVLAEGDRAMGDEGRATGEESPRTFYNGRSHLRQNAGAITETLPVSPIRQKPVRSYRFTPHRLGHCLQLRGWASAWARFLAAAMELVAREVGAVVEEGWRGEVEVAAESKGPGWRCGCMF